MTSTGKSLIGGLASVGLLLSLGGVGLAADTDISAADKRDMQLEKRIETRMSSDKTLKDQGVAAFVKDGTATLTGVVSNGAQKNQAEKLAKVKGVSKVDNQIEVRTDSDVLDVDRADTPPAQPLKDRDHVVLPPDDRGKPAPLDDSRRPSPQADDLTPQFRR